MHKGALGADGIDLFSGFKYARRRHREGGSWVASYSLHHERQYEHPGSPSKQHRTRSEDSTTLFLRTFKEPH